MKLFRFFALFLLFVGVSTADVLADGKTEKTYNRGLGLLKNGYFDNAAKYFTDVISGGEDLYLVSAYLNRAQAYKDANKYDLAFKDIEYLQHLGSYPEPSHLDAFKAELFSRIGELKKSLTLYEKAISDAKGIGTNALSLRYSLGVAYAITLIKDHQFEKAEQEIKIILKTKSANEVKDSADPFLHLVLSVTQILKGEYELAIESADDARIGPQRLMVYPLGAVAANKLGRHDDAISIIEEYVSQKPFSAEHAAVFVKLKKKLWQAEKYPEIDKVLLPQDNRNNLIKFVQYSVVLGHKVAIKNRKRKIDLNFLMQWKFDLLG